MKVIGLNPKQYGLHSLSSGGASAAAIANRLLMRHGGWHSESAKNMYIQEAEETLLRVFPGTLVLGCIWITFSVSGM